MHRLLAEQYSAIEEARADLVALYFLADREIVELGLVPADEHADLVRTEYEYYTRTAMVQLRRVRVRWKEQVWPGDMLTMSARVVKEYEEAGEKRVDLELECTRAGGGIAVQGWATFVS